jgi:hypothetical protein
MPFSENFARDARDVFAKAQPAIASTRAIEKFQTIIAFRNGISH